MVSESDEGQRTSVLPVVLGGLAFVIILVGALVISSHFYQRDQGGPVSPVATSSGGAAPGSAASPAASPASAQETVIAAQRAADAASVKVEQGVVKFYFASGQAELAAGAREALAGVVSAAGSGRTLAISGFHDATGDATKNAQLARRRALVVRDALKALGVPEQQIQIREPEPLPGTSSNAEARRVEISIQ